MTVTFVNLFEVPAGEDDAFRALWQQVNDYMRAKPGYISHKLHRALRPDARYRFANIVIWASEQEWAAAHDDGFHALVGQPAWTAYPPFPTLYEVVHEASAEHSPS
jgi:heme-degrading monooxygenase HmoA